MSGDTRRSGDQGSRRAGGDETLLPAPGKESWDGPSDPSLKPVQQGLGFKFYGKTHVAAPGLPVFDLTHRLYDACEHGVTLLS